MSHTSILFLPAPVNAGTATVSTRDPRLAADAVRRYVEHHECTYVDFLELLHSLGTPTTEYRQAVLDACERLARIEREQDEADRRDILREQHRAEREALREFGGGYRKCRQCGKASCGHMQRKGR